MRTQGKQGKPETYNYAQSNLSTACINDCGWLDHFVWAWTSQITSRINESIICSSTQRAKHLHFNINIQILTMNKYFTSQLNCYFSNCK